MTSGRLDFDNELLSQVAQDRLDFTGHGSVFRVEHAPDRRFIRTGNRCKLGTREAALTESERQRGLCGHAGRNGNATFSGPLCAWGGNVVSSLDSAGNRLLQGIDRFDERFGLDGAGGEALRQVAKRDDDLARAIGLEESGVDEVHGTYPRITRYRKSSRLRPSWRIIAESRPGASSFRRSFTTMKR